MADIVIESSSIPTEAAATFARRTAVKLKAATAANLWGNQRARCTVETCDAQGEYVYGVVMQDKKAAGANATLNETAPNQLAVTVVRPVPGTQIDVVADSAIAAGAEVTVHDNGKFETAAAGDFVCGFALTAAAAADDLFELDFSNPAYKKA